MTKIYSSRGGPVRFNKFGDKVEAVAPMAGQYRGPRTGFRPAPRGEPLAVPGETFAEALAAVVAGIKARGVK